MKVSTTGYKRNSKDKKHKQLYIPGDVLTMLGVDDYVSATPQYPDGSLGQTTTMAPGTPRISFPGAVGVIEEKLPEFALGGPGDPDKPIYTATKSNPEFQIINGKYVFTLPDGSTWAESKLERAQSISNYLKNGWGFTGERLANGEPAWSRIRTTEQPQNVVEPKAAVIPDTTKQYQPGIQRVQVNTDKGDVIKLQDIKTKKFMGYEVSGKPLNMSNATGDPSVDFRQNLKMFASLKPEDETLAGRDTNYREGYYSFANTLGNQSPTPLLPPYYAMYNDGVPYMNPDFRSALLQNRYNMPSEEGVRLKSQGYTFFPESGTWGIDINKQGPGEVGYKQSGGELPQAQIGFMDDLFKRRALKKYPAMQNVYGPKGENLNIIRDKNFDASSHGFGDIEFVFPGSGTVNYSDDYTYQSPTPDKYTAVYNPKGAGRGDVFLDMLHGMRNDSRYTELLQNFGNTVKDARGDDMRYFYEKELLAGRAIDGMDHWNDNYIDGMLRAELYPYTPGRPSARKDYEIERQESSPEMQKAAMDIYNYLRTGPKKLSEQQQGGQLPKAQKGKEWEQLGYENKIYTYKDNPEFFDSHARLHDNPKYNDQLKKMVYAGKWGYNPVTGVAEKLNPDQQKAADPITQNLSKDKRTFNEIRKTDKAFDQYLSEAEKESGKAVGRAQSKAMVSNPAFYAPGIIGAAAVAPEVLPAVFEGIGGALATPFMNPFTGAAIAPGLTAGNLLNAGFITHGVSQLPETYRSWNNAINNGGSYTDALGQTAFNAMDFLGAGEVEGFKPAFKYMGEGLNAAAKYPGQLYNDVATGNSFIPYAWKSPAVGLSQEKSAEMFSSLLNSGKLTPAERALLIEYQFNSNPFTGRFNFIPSDSAKRNALNNIINKYELQFPQNSSAIATRRFNADKEVIGQVASSGKGTLGANVEGSRINFGDRPTSFSAGIGKPGYGGAPDRLVIPSRHFSKMKDNFIVNEYNPLSQEQLQLFEKPNVQEFASKIGTNPELAAERELIGTGLDFKQIGKVKNDIGGFDYIVKPRSVKAKTGAAETTAEAFSDAAATTASSNKQSVNLSNLPDKFNTNDINPDNLEFRSFHIAGKEEPLFVPYLKDTDKPYHMVYRQDMQNYFDSPQFNAIMDIHYPKVDKELYKQTVLKNLEKPLLYNPNMLDKDVTGVYKSKDYVGYPSFEMRVKNASNDNPNLVPNPNRGKSYVSSERSVKHEYDHQRTNANELLPDFLTNEHLLGNLTPEGKALMQQEISSNAKYRVDNYYAKPTEFDVRVRRLKEDLKENGIVDYFNEPITEEHIAQLLEKHAQNEANLDELSKRLWQEFQTDKKAIRQNTALSEAEKKAEIEKLTDNYMEHDNQLVSKKPKNAIHRNTDQLLKYWSPEFLAKTANKLPVAIPVGIGIGAATQQKKKGGSVNKRNHKDLDNYFTQAWSKSRKTA